MAYTPGVLLLAVAALSAQPRFEVVSIHPAQPYTLGAAREGLRAGVRIDKARAEFGRHSINALVCQAYGVKSFQIIGPDWVVSAIFDIQAKLPMGATPEQVPEMLQGMLAERFNLAFHRETKEFPVYVLLPGKDQLKLPPRPADFDAAARGLIRPHTMDDLADFLSSGIGRPVVNQTGLQGEYMLSLEDIAGDFLRRIVAEHPDTAGDRITQNAARYVGGDVFQIIESWGLKLEARKLSLPALIIDHAEKSPTEN